jgi:signal transduction histidine kinase
VRSRLIVAFVVLTVVIIVVFGVPLRGFVEDVERERLLTTLERDAFIMAGHARGTLDTANAEELVSIQPFLDQHAGGGGTRVVVTNARGTVVASNDGSPPIGTSFLNRPEIDRALRGEPQVGERSSSTLGEDLVFVAVPVLDGDEVLGVVRISDRRSRIDDRVRESLVGIALAGLFTVLAAVALAIPVALGLARPIRRLTQHTGQLARGKLDLVADTEDGPGEVRELAAAFNSMARQLRAVMDSQREFNGVVSHQLRTPLTALRLRLEMLQEASLPGSAETREALDAARSEVDRLQEIVEQMLKLSRLESGLVPRVEVDAARIVRSRVEMWLPLAEEKGIGLVVESPGSAMCMAIDGGLDQIVDNYIDNALGVSASGDVIVVKVSASGQQVLVEVVDEGPGLDDAEKSEAFQRFWRKPGSQNSPGTGLGLAIVRQIATASGAEAWFSDRRDGHSGLVASVKCSTLRPVDN